MISKALNLLDTVLDRVIPDKNARAEAKEQLDLLKSTGELDLLVGQLEVNKVEAAHKSMFVAGWRPAVGWICATALGYNFVIYPVMKFAVVVSMAAPPELPVMDTSELMTLLLGMLGLAGYRTYEKRQGVSREQ